MLRLGGERDEVRVVADQRGCPTSAHDLASAILDLADARLKGATEGWGATYHLAGSGACSWADFAEQIFAVSGPHGGPSARVVSIATSDFPTPARRPHNSELDCSAIADRFGTRLPDWRDSVAATVAALLGKAK
jgi:dTDP-4-dehydrorhamnose reductase